MQGLIPVSQQGNDVGHLHNDFIHLHWDYVLCSCIRTVITVSLVSDEIVVPERVGSFSIEVSYTGLLAAGSQLELRAQLITQDGTAKGKHWFYDDLVSLEG